MNYKKLYENLINSAINDPKDDIYKETHHIIPKCMGGNDAKENLVKLTARQHFLAHWLLYKMYKTPSLVYAWNSMRIIGKGQDSRKINSHLFEYAKREKSKMLSIQFTGENNNFFGKAHTLESKQKMSMKLTGRILSNETKQIMSSQRKGVKKTEEHKKKIGRKGLVSLKNINSGESIRIDKKDLDDYDPSVWLNPYSYKMIKEDKIKVTCPVCDKIGNDNSSFRRWHFDNCKGNKT
jgi:NUMOD3 motif